MSDKLDEQITSIARSLIVLNAKLAAWYTLTSAGPSEDLDRAGDALYTEATHNVSLIRAALDMLPD
jgi:hypothetical protein